MVIAIVGIVLVIAIIFMVSSGFIPGLIAGMEGGIEQVPGLG